jgi:hypothetical protein
MSEEVKTAEPEKKESGLENLNPSELIEIIKETRSEAKTRRLKEKELSEKLAEYENKFTLEEQNKKIAEGKKDEVISELMEKLKSKEKEYEPFVEKAKRYDEYDSSKRTKIKSVLGDNWLTSFETLPLSDLEELASKLNNDLRLVDSDNGKGAKPSPKEYFTMEELKGLTPKELQNKEILEKANKSMEFHSKRN